MPEDKNPLKPFELSFFTGLSHLILSFWDKVRAAWFRWAQLNQHTPWFPFFIGAIVALDSIIVILPGDLLVALAALSNPPAWKRIATWAGIGGALGAFALYAMLLVYGKAPLDKISNQLQDFGAPALTLQDASDIVASQPDLEGGLAAVGGSDPPRWETVREFFNKYGPFSLALGSMIPLLSWPLVVIAGLSSDQWFLVLFYLLLGRLARYWILCFGLREGWAMFTTLKQEARAQKLLREQQEEDERP